VYNGKLSQELALDTSQILFYFKHFREIPIHMKFTAKMNYIQTTFYLFLTLSG